MGIDGAMWLKRRKALGHPGSARGIAVGAIMTAGVLVMGLYITAHGARPLADALLHIGHWSRPHSASAPVRPTVTVVSSEYLPHVPGKKVTTVQLDFPPAAVVPKHHHGGSVSVYVVSGSIRSQLAGGPVGTFKAGEMFFEPPGITHVFAENASDAEPARVLAIFVHDDGAVLTTFHE